MKPTRWVTATLINDLAKKNSEALSFIPLPMIERYIDAEQVLIAKENDEFCGFLIFGNGYPVLKVYQACIQYDARRLQHGMDLVNRLIKIAQNKNCSAISLWCADDLEANQFWQTAGFSFCGQRMGGKRRGRKHNRWILPILNLFKEVSNEAYTQRAGSSAGAPGSNPGTGKDLD